MTKKNIYKVLIGFDCPAGRWEAGQTVTDGEISQASARALKQMGAIEVTGEAEQEEDGDS